ncbi:hypothetical protein [Streptomyces laurentii]|uniref:hypothetical protein n=1 Tax=Streptomyces laurentii TaxID=39478 RepID=UPI0033D8623A
MADPWWRTGPQDVHRIEDRISSLYAERCHIDRDDNAIVLVNKARTVHVPAARLAVLIAAPPGLRGRLTRWLVEVDLASTSATPSRTVGRGQWTLMA